MSTAPHIGSVLGDRYELTRHIARGGMGDVYEGTDRLLRRPVAVKLYRAAGPADRERFDAEVLVLAGLNHPGLASVYDAGTVDDDAYVVLELIGGPTLAACIERGLAPAEVARLGAELATALEHIHARGVVHRDLTPANVICDAEGHPRLVDFGIARLLSSPRRTAPQLAIGTASYMAPEQVQGHDVGPAADVYSLGLVLLEALTGRREFDGPAQEVAVARLARDPDVERGVPVAWRPLLARMCARDPRRRPSAAAVHQELQRLADPRTDIGGTAPLPVPVGPTTRPLGRARTEAWATDQVPVLAPVGDPVARRSAATLLGAAAAALVAVVALAAVVANGDGGTGDAATTTTTTPSAAAPETTTRRTTATTPTVPPPTSPSATAPGQQKQDKKKDREDPGAVVPVVTTPTTRPPATTTPTSAPATTAPPASTPTTLAAA